MWSTLGEHYVIGVNRTRRGDFGRNDHESGLGFGVGVGGIRFFQPVPTGFFVGGQLDLWAQNIDWRNLVIVCNVDGDCEISSRQDRGSSQTNVIQPTAVAGYRLKLDETLRLDITVAFGAEINVSTRGKSVGEGAILLGSLALGL